MLWKDALYDYQMYLKLEKRVSANTIEGYLRDIQKLINYSDKQPLDYSQDDLRDFVHDFASSEYSVRSQARVISGLKSFFGYLQLEDFREDNPTSLLETPKIGMKLPDVLSEKEIDIMKNRISSNVPKHKISFDIGTNVRIISGSFADFQGIVHSVDYEKQKAKVTVTIFNRETVVDLEINTLELVK